MALRDKLDSCIGCGCLSLKRCAISNPSDMRPRRDLARSTYRDRYGARSPRS